MKKTLFTLCTLALLCVPGAAKVKLPHLISDGMVIQQNSEVRLWGWDNPGVTVTVTNSWSTDKQTAKTGKDGRWMVKVKAPRASYDQLSITFSDGDGQDVTISDVLSGEVWVCAGQSNMEMPVRGFGNCPVEGVNDVVVEARQVRGVRFCKIPSVMSVKPLDDALCQWRHIDMRSVLDASATGYFFGRLLNRALDIPVGLIEANKGGTRVESWLTRENLKKYTKEPLDSTEMVKKFEWDYHRPLLWGNGTFNPILNYTVKGIIYYQGCSNVGDPGDQYSQRLSLLVDQWRTQFGLGELPFYFVQIAPYYYDDDVNGTSGALLREQQWKASKQIANSALVCTADLAYPYETQQIHPTQKRQVGERLAYQALNKQYGQDYLMCESSEVKDVTFSNDTCYVNVQNDYGAISRFEDIQGFELAGEDRVFHKADAYHYWKKGIVITSPDVPRPVAVRYCFRNFQLGNVKNAAGLPLFPFRSDDW